MKNEMWKLLELMENEGNKKKFRYKGYNCFINRTYPLTHGSLCGYVKLPEGHKYYNVGYDDIPITVHGGLTFAEVVAKTTKRVIPKGYWIGFDCAHYGDLMPMRELVMPRTYKPFIEEIYRDMEFVTKEIKSMVDQLISDEL